MSSQGNINNIKPDKNLMIAIKILDRNSSNHIKKKINNLYLTDINNNNSNKQINEENK